MQKQPLNTHYKINDQSIINHLGFFNRYFKYIPITTKSLENRRSDFQGYHMKAMMEISYPFTSIDLSKSIYDANTDTYDVTKTVGGFFPIILQRTMYAISNFCPKSPISIT